MEGLYTIAFLDKQGLIYGTGVANIEASTIRGGDSNFYYVGDYTVVNHTLAATVRVKRFAVGLDSFLGTDDAEVEFTATLQDGRLTEAYGKILNGPRAGQEFKVLFTVVLTVIN